MSGWISAIAGLAAFAAGLVLSAAGDSEATGFYAVLLAAGAGLWLLAIISYARIREFPGATDSGANGFTEAFARLSLLRDDKAFRQFVIARALA